MSIPHALADSPLRVAAQAGRQTEAAELAPPWVHRFSVTVLVVMLLYATVGIPGENDFDASQTDRVDPLNSWIWLGLLMLAMPVLRQRWRAVLALARASWPLLALIGYFALSVTWALDPGASLRRLLFTIVQVALFAILLSGMRRPAALHVAIAAVCAFAAAADLIDLVVAPGMAMQPDGFAGMQGQKNQAGLLMMYGCLATVPGIFLLRSRSWRAVLVAATLLMLALLAATRSTTSQSVVISAAVVMPLLLLIARWPRRVGQALAACVVLVLGAAALGYLAWCGVSGTDPMLPLRDATFSERTGIWQFVIQEIGKRPWFGAGYSSFWAIDPAVQPSLKSDQWFGIYFVINEGHEGYLDLLATGGVVGFTGGLFVLLRAIVLAGRAVAATAAGRAGWRQSAMARPTAVFHLAFLLGLVVHNFTESNLFSNNALLAVGLLLAVLDLERWRIAGGASG